MTRGLFTLPERIAWENFSEAWNIGNMGTYVYNSLFACILSAPGATFVSLLCAFALSRMGFKYGKIVYFILVCAMMVPPFTVIIPQVMVLNSFNLLNTRTGLLLSYISGGVPFCTFLMYGYLRSIPREIDESALIDGCSDIRRFATIITPLAVPIIATTLILNFLSDWNDYLFALVILRTEPIRTIPLGLINFSDRFGIQYHLLAMGVLIATIPVTIVYLALQKYFIAGLTAGAVKG